MRGKRNAHIPRATHLAQEIAQRFVILHSASEAKGGNRQKLPVTHTGPPQNKKTVKLSLNGFSAQDETRTHTG